MGYFQKYCNRQTIINGVLGIALSTLIPLPAHSLATDPSATKPPRPLSPYSASYTLKARGFSVSVSRKLRSNDNGKYRLSSAGSIVAVGFEEKTYFSVDGTKVVPHSYSYQGKGLLKRTSKVIFEPDSQIIRSLHKDNWYEFTYQPDILDRSSQQEQLRLLLLNNVSLEQGITIHVADGKRLKDYRLRSLGTEELDTPLGTLNTLHLEREHNTPDRSSAIWVAPALDYLIVRTLHVEDGNPVEMLISEAKITGIPASEYLKISDKFEHKE